METANPRAENSEAFMLAGLQALIASLREEQKKTFDLLRASELRADESARRIDLIAREIEEGLLLFDRDGFISLANSVVRTLLSIDVWSRRRYQEVLGPNSELTRRVAACLAEGGITRHEEVHYHTPRGDDVCLMVTIVPLWGRGGEISGALCLLKARASEGQSS